MAYTFDDNKAGLLQIALTDAGVTMANGTSAIPTPPAVLGQIERAFDPTYGAGEFILLVGVANTTVGSLVTFDGTTYQTTLAAVTANQARPVAVAMSACTAGLFGWYQIEGTAVCAKSTSSNFAATVAVGVKSVGKVGATGSGKEILGARTANAATVASATTTVTVVMNRPHLQGRIT